MGFIETIKQIYHGTSADKDGLPDNVLLFALNEVPNPKNTGTMYISCGRRFKTFLRVTLDQAGIDATLTEINRHIDRIRATGFTDTRFDNVSPWAQKQIEDHLASFYIPSRDSKTPVVTQSW